MLPMYHNNIMTKSIERVQTGVRLEKRLLKVLKGLAEHLDMSLGDLLEGMSLHCLEGRPPFSRETLAKIEHTYELLRDDESLATARVTLALVNRDGEVQQVPEWLRDIY